MLRAVQQRRVKARADDRGPDGWTQGSASMRKLLKGVLHSVAPNEVVLRWATKNNKELDKNKRPTRATKIEWLCRSISQGTYRAYVRNEIDSALALIDLMDTAQHVDEFPCQGAAATSHSTMSGHLHESWRLRNE